MGFANLLAHSCRLRLNFIAVYVKELCSGRSPVNFSGGS